MVSSIYTPNKRIDYYRKLSRALMPKQIRAYDPKISNPYAQTAGTNLANVLSGLAQTYFAQEHLGEAERLETAQLAAQRTIGGQFAQMRTPGTGSTLDTTETRMPISDMDTVQRRQQQVRRRPFSMDTAQIPLELQKAAGVTPGLLKERIAEITAGRKEAYTARQEAEIDRKLEGITAAIAITGEGPERTRLQRQRSQLLAIKDAAKAAVRQESQEIVRAKEARGVAEKIDAAKRKRVDVYNVKTEKKDSITQGQMDLDQARITPTFKYGKPEKLDWPKSVALVRPVKGVDQTFVTREQLQEDMQRPLGERLYKPPAGLRIEDGKLVSSPFILTKRKQEKTGEELVTTAFAVSDARALLEQLDEESGLTGIRGGAARTLGGIAGSFVSEQLGEVVTEAISGVSPEEIQSFLVQAKMITAPLLPVITGEESGRFTKAEQDETKAAAALLDIARSPGQIKGALRSILSAYATRLAKIGYVLGTPLDVKSEKGIRAEYRKLIAWGLGGPEAERTIIKIQRAYGELKGLSPETYKALTGHVKK
jgi:hypothetical protein